MQIAIIGAGQAGAALAAKLRALGHQGPITLIGAEPSPPYQRPPLSKAYLLGEMGAERLWLRAPDFWAEQNITLTLGTEVTAIDAQARRITLGESTISYDQLAFTTGSSPRALPSEIGGATPGVYSLRSLEDVDLMRGEFTAGRRLVVIGGGYIGLEAAAVAAKLGLDVTLIEAAPRILQRVAAPETSAYIKALHEGRGVKILEGAKLDRILGDARVTGVALESGEVIAADFVLTGIGVTPNTALAEMAGVTIENGIATDAFGRSSDPAIWAAGDCASFPYRGERIRLESVGNAIDQAEAVAANMIGAELPYQAKPWFWSDQYDLKLQIAGLNTGYDHVVTRNLGGTSFWYYQGERLLAVDAMSDAKAYMVGKRLIEAGKSPSPEAVATESDVKVLMK